MAVPGTQTRLADRYQLREQIASGGTGEVWRADDEVLGREVAVKLLRSEYTGHAETLARFRAEARHAGRLAHPGIVQIYDYGWDPRAGVPFLVMELVHGPSLAVELAGGPRPPSWAADVIGQVAAALAAAHAMGLVHRDIKPANLLLAPGGVVKITDFGIASATGSAPLTQSGMLACTPAYLAPERAEGSPAGPASDLYSLGIVAWEALTGEPPFTGTPLEIALAHVHEDLPPLPARVPAGLAALVAALTVRNPADRPSSADVVARAGQLRAALLDAAVPEDAVRQDAVRQGERARMPATLFLAGTTAHDGPPRRLPRASFGRPRVAAALAGLAAVGGLAAILTATTPDAAIPNPAPARTPASAPAVSPARTPGSGHHGGGHPGGGHHGHHGHHGGDGGSDGKGGGGGNG